MEHAVIVHLRMAGADTGVDLEDRLIDAIDAAGAGEFDGNLLGPDSVELYAYGPDADALWQVMEPIVRAHSPPPGSFAVKRYGPPDDPGAIESRVELA